MRLPLIARNLIDHRFAALTGWSGSLNPRSQSRKFRGPQGAGIASELGYDLSEVKT